MRLEASWLAVVLTLLILCAGCGRSGSSLTKPATQTNSPAMQTNMTNLVAECEQLARDGASQGKDTWTANDPLPPTIKFLSPQYVQLNASEIASVMDIQISGGFQHRGYLVVCATKDPLFVPQKGRDWQITKVAPAVFEYRE